MFKYSFFWICSLILLSCSNKDAAAQQNSKNSPDSTGEQLVADVSANPSMLERRLDSVFTRLHESRAFNGSVLVAKKGKIIFQRHYGFCNKANRCMLNDSSLFQLASVSKVITSTAVLMLMERGKIDIEKNVTEFLPDFPYEKITVKNLLTHRSGLFNYVWSLHSKLYIPGYKMSNADMYNLIKEKKPRPFHKPNKRFKYSNTNYALLALIIERVSGKTFPQFIKEEIFDKVGMKHTTTIDKLNLNSYNVTIPYDERWNTVAFDASDYVLGDKSIYSTAHDLYLFSEAMYNNRLISKQTQKMAYSPYSKDQVSGNYGLGWRMRDFRDSVKKEVFHNGWWHGYRSAFHRRLHDSLTVIVLSNQLNKAAYQTHIIYELMDSQKDSTIEYELEE